MTERQQLCSRVTNLIDSLQLCSILPDGDEQLACLHSTAEQPTTAFIKGTNRASVLPGQQRVCAALAGLLFPRRNKALC